MATEMSLNLKEMADTAIRNTLEANKEEYVKLLLPEIYKQMATDTTRSYASKYYLNTLMIKFMEIFIELYEKANKKEE